MGTTESKIKNGYLLKSSPIFSNKQKEGVKPNEKSTFIREHAACRELNKTSSSEQEESEILADSIVELKKPSSSSAKIISENFEYPYSSIGLVSCLLGDQKVIGTGCLIGPNFVLTCAHNVWSFREKRLGKNIIFSPAFQNIESIAYEAKKIHLPEQLSTAQASPDELIMLDYAVIQLQSENLQNDFGTLGLNFSPKSSGNGPLSIIGYHRKGKDVTLHEMSGEITEDGKLFQYDMDTGYGMSGAPIIEKVQGETQVVGIHVYCRQRNGKVERGGIKLNEKILESLEKWCIHEEEELDLREKNLGKEGIKYLSKHKWANLVSLNLSRNGFEANIAKYLKRGHWKNITNLDLGGNVIGKEGAQALAQSSLRSIATLNLWGNNIGKVGAYFLSQTSWQNLTNLNLYNNDIGDDGVEHISRANWKRLNSLNLGKNGITATGAQHILEGKWINLASLNLWGNNLSGDESLLKSRLQEHFRLLKFLYL